MLEEQVRVQVRQLDRVLDQLDLVVEAADVGVGDVGNLFEHELLDLGPRQPLREQARPRVHEEVVAGAQLHADQLLGELAHALFVGAADDERARAARHELLEHDDLTRDVGAARQHDVQRLVEHDLGTAADAVEVDLRVHRHPHLAAGRQDVDGAVVVGTEVRAVRRRRHRELLDLFAERGDVLARLAEGGRQALVLRDGLGQLALRLEQPLLEGADPLRGVLEPAAEDDDLFLERLQLGLEIADLTLVLGETPLVLRSQLPHLQEKLSGASRRTLHRHLSVPDHLSRRFDDSHISPALA